MKKNLLLIPAVALIMASCTSDEPVSNNGQQPDYAAATSYLNINLVPSSGMGTRADEGNPYDGDITGTGTYEDGMPKENNVTRVRFYFFGEGGLPFAVRQNLTNDEFDNFVDWYPNSTEVGGPDHDMTVEKTLNATLGLTFTDNDERPSQVLAVANPTNEILYYESTENYENMSKNSMSLSELQGVVANYLPYDNNNFVMSNSVYVANNEVVYTTTLTDNNFQPTPAAAAQPANIVTIFIERVLARVDFGITLTPADLQGVTGTFYPVGTYTLHDGDTGEDTEENAAIYVKFLGWNVTSTTGTSRLIKEVNKSWTNAEIMGGETGAELLWNTADYHRSFWALNPETVEIQLGNFGPVKDSEDFKNVQPNGQVANSLAIPGANEFTITYLQENANPWSDSKAAAAPEDPSKVIIAAQLVDAQGNPLTICEWGYNKYTLQGLKNQLAKALPNLYYKTEVNGQEAWKQIEANMITFTTVDPLGDDVEDKEYYVYAVLDNTTTAGLEWALKSGPEDDDFEPFTSQDGEDSVTEKVNKYIRGIVNHAMIWNSGLTYYYFDIRHLGDDAEDAGYVGIVRNHLYRTTVTSLKGLGTPVYDPGLVIHPQVTNPGETVIQAKINILSWRLVQSSYQLDWE